MTDALNAAAHVVYLLGIIPFWLFTWGELLQRLSGRLFVTPVSSDYICIGLGTLLFAVAWPAAIFVLGVGWGTDRLGRFLFEEE
jgi:hypothetical protein